MPDHLAAWQSRFSSGAHEGLFRPQPLLGARIGIYTEGFWLRCLESLREDFPLTAKLLGEREFENACRGFLTGHVGGELELGELSPKLAAHLAGRAGRGLARAVRVDLLALEARRAAEPVLAGSGCFGLHPSVRFLEGKGRDYVLWRSPDGGVLRERVAPWERRLLECFRVAAPLRALQAKLAALGGDPEELAAELEAWIDAGAIVEQG